MNLSRTASRLLSPRAPEVSSTGPSRLARNLAATPRVAAARHTTFSRQGGGMQAKPPASREIAVFQPREKGLVNVQGFRQQPGEDAWGMGFPQEAQRSIDEFEQQPLTARIESTKTGPLKLQPGEVYVFLIDPDRGITYAKERETPTTNLPTRSGGVTHPMIRNPDDGKASLGGEMRLDTNGVLNWNTKSGRYSSDVDDQRREATQKALENLAKDGQRLPFSVRFVRDL